MPVAPENRPEGTVTLISDVVSCIGALIKGELRLARAEAAGAARRMAGGVVSLMVAVVFGLVGLNVLAGAAVAGLVAAGLAPAMAGAVTGLLLCGLGAGFALAGRAALRSGRLWPNAALRRFEEDAALVRTGLGRSDPAGEGVPHG